MCVWYEAWIWLKHIHLQIKPASYISVYFTFSCFGRDTVSNVIKKCIQTVKSQWSKVK